ncbi:N-formylglutamate amidohydrolase [Paracraurococcus ruber]|uniref:N-formylglutamate amidohydrolase n=1 Tax=Paracraurococcus ruber TaxID=77675 RepID=A0ABS1D2S7_9PROT|nr:N-formylglutamate amidohydrolase [Paracraurococcus ruber]MBK1660392.1 N-formylglutamate amidohydrolase [Paracraurococcus ruber]TDG27892.1 N-formylglutamate amidohydrolase [Paracraurococcus ruber]
MTPAPVTVVNESGGSPFVLLCEHASNWIPPALAGLGLPPADLVRHIAWDIGAAGLARDLSRRLDAPLFLGGCSRLVIDLNRPPGAPTSIPVISEATAIPGNGDLPPAERARREADWFHPFHDRVAALLDQRRAAGRPAAVIGVHSFTPVFLGVARPWHAGILHARAEGFGRALVARLAAEPGLVVGDNEPYRIEPEHDYTVPVHGDARGLDAVLLEVRQDLLATQAGIEAWAARLAAALAGIGGPRP